VERTPGTWSTGIAYAALKDQQRDSDGQASKRHLRLETTVQVNIDDLLTFT
jgi:hypothetical protein